jgi:hypothetical protein
VDGVFYDAEDVEVFSNRDADRLVSRVRRFEPHAIRTTTQAFHRVLAVKGHDDNAAVVRLRSTIHYKKITVEDAGVSHGIAIDPHQERGGLVLNQEVVEIERGFKVVLSGTRKACGDASIEIRQNQRPVCRPFQGSRQETDNKAR